MENVKVKTRPPRPPPVKIRPPRPPPPNWHCDVDSPESSDCQPHNQVTEDSLSLTSTEPVSQASGIDKFIIY